MALKWSTSHTVLDRAFMSEADFDQFNQLRHQSLELDNLSPAFNNVSIYMDALATSLAAQHYIDHIQKLREKSDVTVAEDALQKLLALLMMSPNYFNDLSAQQQLTLYEMMHETETPVHDAILVHFFMSIQPYPEFTIETLKKEQEFMIAFLERGMHKDLETIWATENVTHMCDFIGKIVALKASIWKIPSPSLSYRYLDAEAGYHDQGVICFDIQPGAETFDPRKALALISHEMDHYIHYKMHNNRKHLMPKTENEPQAHAYIDMLYGDKMVYVHHHQHRQLYRNSPTEQIAFQTTDLWERLAKNWEEKPVIAFMDAAIQHERQALENRQELWNSDKLKKRLRPL